MALYTHRWNLHSKVVVLEDEESKYVKYVQIEDRVTICDVSTP
jgi:hypothetical protein